MSAIRVTSFIATFVLGACAAFAAPPQAITVTVPGGNSAGATPQNIPHWSTWGADLQSFKAQNHLSAATNQQLVKEKSSSGGTILAPGIKNGTVDTIPYFNSWFVTGERNSIYTYSMVGHNPVTGGTTTVNNVLIPLVIRLRDANNNIVAIFDPTGGFTCGPGSDMSLTADSPIYNSAHYPGGGGLAADDGQFTDTTIRASFNSVRAANWHTPLGPPLNVCTDLGQNNHFYLVDVPSSNWVVLGNNVGYAVDINYISNVFAALLAFEDATYHDVPNTSLVVILTDNISAYIPGGGCCVLGYHTAQNGIEDPAGILVWTWASFFPHANIFGAGVDTVTVLSHEMSELYHDPFVNTNVSPWVDGSVSFAQGNLETGDVIEAMSVADSKFSIPGYPTVHNGVQNYAVQNEALLNWFTRNPLNGAAYSWPNTGTLSHCVHPPALLVQSYCYGEGSGGFFFGPPY